MCGIAGVVLSGDGDFSAAVAAMQDALAHRGPDGAGEFHEPSVMLAMRRLSIIDLSGGWQPLYSEDRGVVLIANGEIYNFVELRSDLEGRGHRFQTKSDCETIVHLYEDHGIECVQHLRGMFAFALWDRKRRRLLLARDRMGEKPLYVHTSGTRLVFSSEMKSLLQSGLAPFELDPVSVHLYFHYQFVPDPLTPLSGIRKLPAGHRLVVDVDPWNIREECYWRMEDAPPIDADPAEAIRAQLDEVARLVIRSDVPVGIALSGGLDSGAIAVLAAKHYPGSMRAFSVGYPGRPPSDERAHA
jgi:asparagine synthase (glutamine-hydrolysing)